MFRVRTSCPIVKVGLIFLLACCTKVESPGYQEKLTTDSTPGIGQAPAMWHASTKAKRNPVAGLLFPHYTEGRWVYIDETGKVALNPERKLRYAFRFQSSLALAAVNINEETIRYGYIDRSGTMVIQPHFEGADEFSEDLALVKVGGLFGFMATNGKMAIAPKFDYALSFSEGLAVAEVDGKSGYIDRSGNFAIKPKYSVAGRFSEGLAPVNPEGMPTLSGTASLWGKWGFIDKEGQMVIQPQFDQAGSFSEGLAWVKIGEMYGYIDKAGKIAIGAKFTLAGSFSEGLAGVETNGKCGYIDMQGKMVIEAHFDCPRQIMEKRGWPIPINVIPWFSEGRAMAFINGRVGYVDKTGKIVIEPQFYDGEAFWQGLARVTSDVGGVLQNGYIDRSGKWVRKPE